jgi:hypothetical protein
LKSFIISGRPRRSSGRTGHFVTGQRVARQSLFCNDVKIHIHRRQSPPTGRPLGAGRGNGRRAARTRTGQAVSGTETYRIGIDVGGTFTDLVFVGNHGALLTRKVPTTPDNYGRGIVTGIVQLMQAHDIAASRITAVIHATTVATNTILEIRGARTGLITTKGFRDVLEFRRLRIPEMYTLTFKRPEPLVPRNLRFEIDERLGADGSVVRPLDLAEVDAVADRLTAAGAESVAVCLINSYANKAHEVAVAARLAERMPAGTFVTWSADLLPEIREYERTSTTVINGYLGPVLARYFASLVAELKQIGVAAPVQVMKSDGGVMSVAQASLKLGRGHRRRGHGEKHGPAGPHHARHGGHHRQGRDGRGRRGDQDLGLRGRRGDQPVQPAGDGRRPRAQAAGDRHLGNRRGRRQHHRLRPGRRHDGRPEKRRCLARPRRL